MAKKPTKPYGLLSAHWTKKLNFFLFNSHNSNIYFSIILFFLYKRDWPKLVEINLVKVDRK